jgi:hypothetical protein
VNSADLAVTSFPWLTHSALDEFGHLVDLGLLAGNDGIGEDERRSLTRCAAVCQR